MLRRGRFKTRGGLLGRADTLTRKTPVQQRHRRLGQHDNLYHLLFGHKVMVEHLVRGFLADTLPVEIDFSDMRLLNVKFDELRGHTRREGDVVWQLRLKDGREAYLILMLEFQATDDHWMALRTSVYQGLSLQQIINERHLGSRDSLPPVFTVVLYNGDRPWRSPDNLTALFGLADESKLLDWQPGARYYPLGIRELPEASLQDRGNLATLMILLERRPSSGAELEALYKAFTVWFRKHPDHDRLRLVLESMMRRAFREVRNSSTIRIDFTGMHEMPETMGQKWERTAEARGVAKGEVKGKIKGKAELVLNQMRHKFGDLPSEIEAVVESASEQQLDEWCLRVLSASTPDEVLDTQH